MKYNFLVVIVFILTPIICLSQLERKVFLEHFTNTNCVDCVAINTSLYELLNGNENLIHLSYHIGLPDETGFFYEQNTEDNLAAQNYYAITAMPSLNVNGSLIDDSPELLTQNTLNLVYGQNLISPFIFTSFNIEEQANGSFRAIAIVSTEAIYDEGSYIIRMAIVESEINELTNNGESLHINVMRKMIGGFEGKIFDPPTIGNGTIVSYNFNIENSWEKENIFLIGWIQNAETKEIVTAESSKNFAAPLQSSIAELINVSCFEEVDGGINITVENGVPPYTYLWSNGSTQQNLSNVVAGIYSVEITDAAGTTITEQASVSEPTSFLVDLSILAESNSNADGSAEISITGATPFVSNGKPYYKVEWSNGIKDSLHIDNLAEATYSFVITDANGCTYSDEFFIPNNIGDLRCDFLFENPKCNGDSSGNIVLSCRNFAPPVLYNWSDGAISRARFDLKAGTYSVVVTDQLNAVYNVLIELEDPILLKNNLEIINETNNLGNGAAFANPSGGFSPYSIEWLPGGSINLSIDSLSAENSSGNLIEYVCNVTDYNGCKVSTPFTLQSNGFELNISIIEQQNITCFGQQNGSVEIAVTGGNMGYDYDIDWFIQKGAVFEEIPTTPSNTTILNNLNEGIYLVMVTDDDNLSVTDTIKIEEPPVFEISIEDCNVQVDADGSVIQNGSASVNATGGVPPYLYQWSNGSANSNTNINVSSNLTVTVFDANNCQQQQTVFIDESTESCVLSNNEFSLLATDVTVQPSLVKNIIGIYSNYPINELQIFDLAGKAIFKKSYNKLNEISENLNNTPNGIYLITVTTNKGILTKKIMKY